MTEEKKEPLNVEEPKKTKTEPDVDGLLQTLSQFGIEDAKALSGKLDAGTQAGRLAQLYGDEKKRTGELEAKIRELESAQPIRKKPDYVDDYQGTQEIDIDAALERSIEKVWSKKEAQQRKIQEANLQKWNYINSDTNYSLVKDVWEQRLKDPNFSFKLSNGIVDPVQEYNNTVINYMKTLLKQSHDTIKTIRGGPKEAPFVEVGGRSSANIVSETEKESDAEKLRKELRAKVDKGELLSNDEELSIIDSIFGPTPRK